MKDLITGCISSIIRQKTENNVVPTVATELELKHAIMDMVCLCVSIR